MAYDLNTQNISLIAGADLSAKQYYVVKIHTDGTAVLCGAGEKAAGSLQNKPTSAQFASVQVGGIAKFSAGAGITAGADVASNLNAQVITATTGKAVVGIALVTAGAANDIIPVLITQSGLAA